MSDTTTRIDAPTRINERLFPQLSPEELSCLAAYGEPSEVPAGTFLFRQGEPLTHLFAVLDGEVRVTRQANGQDIFLCQHRAGNFTGDLTLLTGGQATASAR